MIEALAPSVMQFGGTARLYMSLGPVSHLDHSEELVHWQWRLPSQVGARAQQGASTTMPRRRCEWDEPETGAVPAGAQELPLRRLQRTLSGA
eukprot:3578056-Rhodomonas_salina.4